MSGREPPQRVLVVDDRADIRALLSDSLSLEGFAVEQAADGETAMRRVVEHPPDVVVLDVMLPGPDGLEILRRLRAVSPVPVIMLTAQDTERDRVEGLDLGADDYVVKPFLPRELAARVRSVLRRVAPPEPATIEADGLVIDTGTREVRVDGTLVELTAKELDLLVYLATRPRQSVSRDELLHHVWRSSPDWQDPATVTEHVRRLRRKIERDPSRPRWICTVRGAGYRFEP